MASLRSYRRMVASVSLGAVAAAVGALGGQQAFAAIRSDHRSAEPVEIAAAPATTVPFATLEADSGNLEVVVPLTPSPEQIDRFCVDLLAGRTPPPGRSLAGFTTETGGSTSASTAWCRTYQARARHRPAPGGAGR